MASLFVNQTDVVVRGALDGLAARHRAFVNNLANVETPGFQPSDVPFEEELRRVRDEIAGDPARIAGAPTLDLAPVADDQNGTRLDENGVQIDQQVMRLAENTLTYEALTQIARVREQMLRTAITEGRR